MKGLLLKDFYMMKKYCKAYLLLAIVFLVVSFSGDNLFFAFYPCLIGGMIPVNLIAYDERSRWMQYSGTLPYTKAQLVSCKYCIGLLVQLAMVLITGIAQAIGITVRGTGSVEKLLAVLPVLFILSTVTSSITLPFVFKFGVEKGRIAFYLIIGLVCAGSVLVSNLFDITALTDLSINATTAAVVLAGAGIYALSWYLSIAFYQKRELA